VLASGTGWACERDAVVPDRANCPKESAMNQDLRRAKNRTAMVGFQGRNAAHEAGSLLFTGDTRRTLQYPSAVGLLTATWGIGVTVHGLTGVLTDPRFRHRRTDPRLLGSARPRHRRCRSSSSPDTVPPPRPYERTTREERAGDALPRPKPRPTTLPTSCAARRADSPSPIASAPTTSSAGASRRERRGRGRGRLLRFIGSTAARRRRSRRTPRPAPLPLSRGRAGTPDAVTPEPA